jgi:phenylpropionate dioxygenase-like ring-hydroxylating dioxygenase large terminal subunit
MSDSDQTRSAQLYLQERYHFIWLCIGSPLKPLFSLEEFAHPQARIVPCGAYGVRTSPLRAVENFLDMAHFPYVHAQILGAEPFTEVSPYQVHVDQNDELWATDCCFVQPQAAPNSSREQITHYTYRVVSPLNVLLYKINTEGSGLIPADVICLFIQPISQTQIRAHLLMILDDQSSSMTDMVLFQQHIFTQDKPILENHHPLKLPLTGKLEIATRADLTANHYREWLRQKQWRYGAIWATEELP